MQTYFTIIGIAATVIWFATSSAMLRVQHRRRKGEYTTWRAKAITLLLGPAAPVIAWFMDLPLDSNNPDT